TKGLEEERRLAYVGLTRARQRVMISSAANRLIHGSWTHAIPSRFISELPPAHIDKHVEPGMFTGPPPEFGGSHRGAQVSFTGGRDFHHPPRPPVVLEGYAKVVERKSEHAFRRGERVFHQKFGYGEVKFADGDKLEITFEHAGDKKVMAGFVVPADKAAEAQ
ncbi:MAG TPA: 3'-5' exonuclease, partial [Alphaproteobacteria bacterium]|nr:3'-5' exonuclease [Alphaproteobacteria bacterium]